MKRWTNLGFVETIYEEESSSSSSSSKSPLPLDLSSPSMELQSKVQKWSLVNNCKPNVFIHVRGTRFHLHKDPLSAKSSYLKRHLTITNELTLSPPLNLTAETFSLITGFCYGAQIQLTPFNLVSLKIAAEILQLTGDDGRENLLNLTEIYFRRVVAVDVDYIQIVLRSCLAQLPESETTVFLIGRCIEALIEIGNGDRVNDFFDEAVELPAGDFVVVVEALQRRFPRHDLIYRVVDAYVEGHNGELTEEEKVKICNCIDCGTLSPPLLLHAVQNPKLPLRFIVRAMLQEQLNTRHSIIAAATAISAAAPERPQEIETARNSTVTLRSLLQRDTATRQNNRLRAAMDSTSSRIKTLEKELEAMKKFISEKSEKQSEKQRSVKVESRSRSVMDSARSASFNQPSTVNKTERGEKGSVSSLSTTFRRRRESPPLHRRERSIGKRLINGLKTAFSSSKVPKKSESIAEEIYDGLEDFVWIDDHNISEDLHSLYLKNK